MSDFLDLQGAKDLNTDAIHIGAVANSKDPATGTAIDTHVNRVGGTDYTLRGFWNAIGPVVMPWNSVVGGTLTQPNQAFLHPADGNYYSWAGEFPKVVAPGADPTSDTGYVPRAKITPSVTEALRRSYAEAGLSLVDGSFEEGGTLTSATDVLLHRATGVAYSWSGVFPKVVAAGSTPTPLGSGGWIDRSDVTLRDEVDIISVSRALNVPLSSVIYSNDTSTPLDDVAYIYDLVAYVTWKKPSRVGVGEFIVGVSGSTLTTTGGVYSLISVQDSQFNSSAFDGATSYNEETNTYSFASRKSIQRYTGVTDEKLVSSGVVFSFDVPSGAVINAADVVTSGGVAFSYPSNSKKTVITNSKIESTSSSNSHAFNMSNPGVEDAIISSNITKSNGFGVLSNSSCTVDGLVISGNVLNAGSSDGIEINNPGRLVQENIAITGNVIRVTQASTGENSGFLVSVAAGKNIAIVGNSGTGSNGEAYHFEDDQNTNVLVGNTATECQQEGVWVGKYTDGAGEGLPVVGNSLRASVGNSSAGMLSTFTVGGSLSGMTFVGNRVYGFDRGVEYGREITFSYANSIEACNIGILGTGRGDIHGTSLLKSCQTAIKTTSGCMVGGFATNEMPTSLVNTDHAAGSIGTVVREMHFVAPSTTTVAGVGFSVDLFDLPDIMYARVICRCKNKVGTDNLYVSANVKWDGATLTVSDKINKSQGTFGSTVTLSNNAGKFNLSVFSSATFDFETKVSIIGEYYQL